MALTADVPIVCYGTNEYAPLNQPANASITIYRGSIALTDSTGYLKNASSPASTDLCWGLIDESPTQADTGSGIATASTLGQTTINIRTGAFFLYCSTGTDALAQSNVGQQVYVFNETTVARTSGGGTRPLAGTLKTIDTTQPYGQYAVDLNGASVAIPGN